MKFTATSFFTAIATGAAKVLQWKVYVRKVTDLSESLTGGTAWVEVTNRIKEIPTISQKAEIETGISTSSSLSLTGLDLAWWEANVFDATAAEYIEIKITCQIGSSASNLASDIVYAFHGYIEKKHSGNEVGDEITMTAYTLDDLLEKLSGELLTLQYINSDVDGGGLDGIFLPSIPGVYVTDANITSYVLKQGVHTISYEYNAGGERAKLDDGDWVNLSNGENELANTHTNEFGVSVTDQKVLIYCDDSLWPITDADQEIIVKTYGETLPYTWYQGISVHQTLKTIYSLIGINNVSLDTFSLETFDGRKTKSFIGIPPGDGTFYDKVRCISYDERCSVPYRKMCRPRAECR